MRIVGGISKGIPLRVPDNGVRPTSDRVREALFSILGELVLDASCIDLFAGSGSLGIEALSRGAKSCVFVDRSHESCGAIKYNLEKARLVGGTVREEQVLPFLSKINDDYDLIFADPPYKVEGIVEELVKSDALISLLLLGGVLIIEASSGDVDFPCHEGIKLLTVRKYGDSQLILYRRDNNIDVNDI
tara:strand:+ start:88 stop:651 length:564 start_codon:yes stop_codon:yes gene_type:complete